MALTSDIAADVLPIIAEFAYGGPAWSVWNVSGAGVNAAATLALQGSTETVYVLEADFEAMQKSFPGTPIGDQNWIAHQAFASTSAIVGGSVITDGTRHFRFLSEWKISTGMKIARVELTGAPS